MTSYRSYTYNPETGEILRDGKPCTFKSKAGYLIVSIGGENIMAHHVAWFLHRGRWPSGELDHKDCDPTNNAASNLRLAKRWQNLANRRAFKTCTSGVKGLTWHKNSRRWRFQIWRDSKMFWWGCSSWFSAVCAARLIRRTLHGEFAKE